MTSLPGRFLYYFFPIALLITLIVVEWLRILHLNDSIFSYTLDDPYIHLSLAKQISMGGYGFNQGEISSPSSSILWPFLLVPFSHLSFFEFIPLILNSLLSIFILIVFISCCLAVNPQRMRVQWGHLLIFCLLVPALNLLGLIFSGMEHGLQMLFSLLVVSGLILESRTKQFTLWLAVIIIAGPLVRYENLSLSVPALFFLFYRGHRKKVIYTALIMLILLGLFSLFLLHLGQPPLPSSILNKVDFGLYHSFIEGCIDQFNTNLTQRQGFLFLILLIAGTSVISFSKLTLIKKQLLTVLTVSLLLHLFLGKFNWFHRYELYLYAAILLFVCYLYFDSYQESKHALSWYYLLLLGFIVGSYPYFTVLYNLPLAAHNIYQQQYQMRKFVLNWVKSPVAVNDIGWVAFNNPSYVLDLWGLGNFQVYKMRTSEKNCIWMEKLAKEHQIKLAMIYKNWFHPTPANWIPLGCLSFDGPRVSAANTVVYFYATNASYAPALKVQLLEFSKTLPKGEHFNFHCH